MKQLNFLFLFVFISLPLLAQQESAQLTAAQRRQALAIQIAEQTQQTPGDIYRGTVVGAEQKTYQSDTLGARTPAQKKYVYDTSLMRAVKINDEDRVRTLLYAHINPNERNYDGSTPLAVAAENGNLPIMHLLIEEGHANIDWPSANGVTPLIAAVRSGKEQAAQYLIEKGANTQLRDHSGRTPLSYAAQWDNPALINTLCKKNPIGANLPDNTGMTPLLYAAQKGYTQQARVLLNNGANPNYRHPSSGLSALATAAAEGNTKVMQTLLQSSSTIVDIPDATGRTPLMYAIEQEKEDSVQVLLKQKANVNAQDRNGMTPLMYAAAKGNTAILDQLLHQKSLQPNYTDALGRTALFYSIYAPSTESAKLLLTDNNINAADQHGNTPLLYAIKAQKDPMALFFIQQGASLVKADNQGATAFMLAPLYLPGSATEKVLQVKKQSLQADALQEQAARLADVRALEQQLRAEEAQVQQLKTQQFTNLQNKTLQEQERLRNIAHAQQVKTQLQQAKVLRPVSAQTMQQEQRLQNIARAQQVKAEMQQAKMRQPLSVQKATTFQRANNAANQTTRTNVVYYDAFGRPVTTTTTTTTRQISHY